ncbi:hypothetical protein OED34_002988 [Salmonella enterica]|nr:hypothetical protein [Salmonella enterica]EJX9791826.1 hypothetical protein [Salmonella enterica]ELH0605510.1 hypothetical protein [Salmonella enterica]ELH4633373.1 hypothetical protein [Salmonella enterica]
MKYFVKMVDTGSLTPVAEMADKFLVQAKRFPSISQAELWQTSFWQRHGTSGFYRAFPERFFHQPVFYVRVNPLSQQPFWPRHGVVWHRQAIQQGKPQWVA